MNSLQRHLLEVMLLPTYADRALALRGLGYKYSDVDYRWHLNPSGDFELASIDDVVLYGDKE